MMHTLKPKSDMQVVECHRPIIRDPATPVHRMEQTEASGTAGREGVYPLGVEGVSRAFLLVFSLAHVPLATHFPPTYAETR